MTDEHTSGLRFRVSACGKFIVAQVGERARPHVLTAEEAEKVAQLYREAGAKAGLPAIAMYENATATLLQIAINELRRL